VNVPTLKLRRTTVVVSGADEHKEAAQLRARLAELERTPEEIAQAEAERYAEALHDERRAQESHLRLALQLGDRREQVPDPDAPSGFSAGDKTGTERAAELTRRLESIDAEINRVTKLKANKS
jgi:hypothetical protein